MTSAEADTLPYVVGVGASAGGLEALTALLEATPNDSGMAFVIIQHLSPDYRSMMVELLSSHTAVRVIAAQDGMRLEADTAYVMQPQTTVRLSEGHLSVAHASERTQLPIDLFFESMAADRGQRCAAIILSGTGGDGSQGLRAVKEAGGATVVQRPETARFDGMPEAALATGAADLVLRPAEMTAELIALRADGAGTYFGPGSERSGIVLSRVLADLRSHTGLDFSYYKPSTIERRIERRMKLTGISDMRAYAEHLRQDGGEAAELQRDMLIGVTKFLRDAGAFEVLRRTAIPRLVEAPGTHPLRLWVAGCSTGEEAYSLAILVHRGLEEAGIERDFKIFATDIHSDALAIAGRGEFSRATVEALPADLRERYFRQHGEVFTVSKQLREKLLFSRHNVITDPGFSRMDMVSCRNLLIYLKQRIQDRVIRLLGNALNPGGLLWLGSSESLGEQANDFHVLDSRWKLFAARNDRARSLVVPLTPTRTKGDPIGRPDATEMGGLAESLLQGYLPPTVVVDESLTVHYHYGNFNGLLRFPQGKMNFDLREWLPRDVAAMASTAIQRVRKSREDIRYTGLTGQRQDESDLRFNLVARALPHGTAPLFALIFEQLAGEPEVPHTVSVSQSAELTQDMRDRMTELERELRFSRESLQATVEELESSNEELQATNEELVASNEELQSTNEELQSVNEELHTVNSEHAERLDELSALTDDVDGLLNSLDVGIVFLDPRLCVRRFNPRATAFISVLPQDCGRPLAHLNHALEYPGMLDDCALVIRTGAPVSRRVLSGQQHLQVRISPVEGHNGSEVRGLVLSITDVTDLVSASSHAARLTRALERNRSPQCLLDSDGRIVQTSAAFAQLIGRDPEYLLGTHVVELSRPEDRAWVKTALQITLGGGGWSGILEGERPDKTPYWELVHLLANRQRDGSLIGAIRISEDISAPIGALSGDDTADAADRQYEYFVWSAADDTTDVTKGVAALYGAPPEKRINLGLAAETMAPEDIARWQAALRAPSGRIQSLRYRVVVDDEERVLEASLFCEGLTAAQDRRVFGRIHRVS